MRSIDELDYNEEVFTLRLVADSMNGNASI